MPLKSFLRVSLRANGVVAHHFDVGSHFQIAIGRLRADFHTVIVKPVLWLGFLEGWTEALDEASVFSKDYDAREPTNLI